MAGSTKQVYTLEMVTKGLNETVAQLKTLNTNLGGSKKVAKDASAGYRDVGKSAGEADRNMKGAAKATNNSTKSFSKMAQGMQGTLVPAYATVAANVFALTAAFGALSRAADLQILIDSAEELSAQTGRSLVSLADNMKEITDGALSMKEALTSASIAASAGFDNSTIEDLTQVARNASVALGRDLTDSINRVFKGAIKAEPELLDELGIILRLEPATAKYAATLGKAASELTTFEKQQAIVNAVLEQGQEKFEAFGDVDTNPYTKLAAAFSDIANSLITLISIPVGGFLTFFTENTGALTAAIVIFSNSVLQRAIPALESLGTSVNEVIDKSFADLSISEAVVNLEKDLDGALGSLTGVDKGILTEFIEQDIKNLKELGSDAGQALAEGLDTVLSDPNLTDEQKLSRVYLSADDAITSLKNNTEALGSVSKKELGQLVGIAGFAKEALSQMGVPLITLNDRIPKFLSSWTQSFKKFINIAKGSITTGFFSGLVDGVEGVNRALLLTKIRFEDYEKAGTKISKLNRIMSSSFLRLAGAIGIAFKVMNTMIPIIGQITIAWALLSEGVSFFVNLFRDENALEEINDSLENQAKAIETAEKTLARYNKEASNLPNTLDNSNKELEIQKNVLLELNNTLQDLVDNTDADSFGFFGADLDDFSDNLERQLDILENFGAIEQVNALLEEYGDISNLSAEEVLKLADATQKLAQEQLNTAASSLELNKELENIVTNINKSSQAINGSLPALSGMEQMLVSISSLSLAEGFTDPLKLGSAIVELDTYTKEAAGVIDSIDEITNSLVKLDDTAKRTKTVEQSLEETSKLLEEQQKLLETTSSDEFDLLGELDLSYAAEDVAELNNKLESSTKELEDLNEASRDYMNTIRNASLDAIDKFSILKDELSDLINIQKFYNKELILLKFELSLPGRTFFDNLKTNQKILETTINKLKLIEKGAKLAIGNTEKSLEKSNEILEFGDKINDLGGGFKIITPATDSDREKALKDQTELITQQIQLQNLLGNTESDILNARIENLKDLREQYAHAVLDVEAYSNIIEEPHSRENAALDALKKGYKSIGIFKEKEISNYIRLEKEGVRYAALLEKIGVEQDPKKLVESNIALNHRLSSLNSELSIMQSAVGLSDDRINRELILQQEMLASKDIALRALQSDPELKGKIKDIDHLREEIRTTLELLDRVDKVTTEITLSKENEKIKAEQKLLRERINAGFSTSKAATIQLEKEQAIAKLKERTDKLSSAAYKERLALIKEQAKLQTKANLQDDFKNLTESAREFSDVMQELYDRLKTVDPTEKLEAGLAAIGKIAVLSDSSTAEGLAQLSILTQQFGEELDGSSASTEQLLVFSAQAAGAIANMFEDSSIAAESLRVVQSGLALVHAVNAVLYAATSGDPYTVFARMAAVASAATALLSQINVSFSGKSGGFTAANPESYETSYGSQGVYGVDLQTNSLVESTEALIDIETALFGVNRDLKISVVNLNKTFSAVGAAIFNQAGSFSNANILEQFGVQFGTDFNPGFFGDTTKTNELLSAGIQFGATVEFVGDTLAGAILDADAFLVQQITKTKSGFAGFGGGTKTRIETRTADLEPRIVRELEDALSGTLNTVVGLFGSLGSDLQGLFSTFEGIDIDVTKIDLSGKSAEDQSAAIAAFFSNLTNEVISDIVPGLREFSQAGEELTDVLIRLSTETQEINTSFSTIGLSIEDLGVLDNAEAKFNEYFNSTNNTINTVNKDILEQINAIESVQYNRSRSIGSRFKNPIKQDEFERNKARIIAELEKDLGNITNGVASTVEAFKVETIAAWNDAFLSGFEDTDEMSEISQRFYEALFSEQELADIAVRNAREVVGLGISELSSELYSKGFSNIAKLLSEDIDSDMFRTLFDALLEVDAFASVSGAELLNTFIRTGAAIGDLENAVEEATEEIDNLNQQYERQIALFGLLGKELELLELDFDFEDALKEAEETGTDMLLVETYYGLERLDILKKYNEEILAEFEDMFKTIENSMLTVSRSMSTWDEVAYQSAKIEAILKKLIPTLTTPVNVSNLLQDYDYDTFFEELFDFSDIQSPESISEQIALVGELESAVMARYNAEIEAIQETQQAIQDLKNYAIEISDYIDSLYVQDIAPTSSYEKLAEATRQFNENLSNLNSEDEDIAQNARDNLLSSADTLLELASGFYSIGDDFQNIFNYVVQSLEGVEQEILDQIGQSETEKQTQDLIDQLSADAYAQLQTLNNILYELEDMNETSFTSEIENAALIIGDALDEVILKLESLDSSWNQILDILEGMNSYSSGTENVEFDQMAFIHKGEAILSQDKAAALRQGELSLISDSPEQKDVTANVDNSDIVDAITLLTQVVATGNEESLEQSEKIAEATTLLGQTRNTKGRASIGRLI